MTMQDKNTATGELSYFETTLLLYLKESHPHIAGDKEPVSYTHLDVYKRQGEYNTLLNLYNITVYEVRGSVDGKEYHGIMYGALDDNGQQVGTPFKSSK